MFFGGHLGKGLNEIQPPPVRALALGQKNTRTSGPAHQQASDSLAQQVLYRGLHLARPKNLIFGQNLAWDVWEDVPEALHSCSSISLYRVEWGRVSLGIINIYCSQFREGHWGKTDKAWRPRDSLTHRPSNTVKW